MSRIFLPVIVALTATAPAWAQDAPPSTTAAQMAGDLDDHITVGVGAAYIPDYEGSNDYQVTAVPAAIGSYKGFSFALIGNRASIDLIPNSPDQKVDLQLGPIGVINFNRGSHDSIDDPRVRRLAEVDTAVELGGYAGIGKRGVLTSPYDKLSVSLSYRHDVSGVHKSGIWQPTINYLAPLSTKAAVGLFASAQHAGEGYADTYFSITPAETLATGMPTYNAHAGWKDYTLGALATYSLTGNLLHGFKIVAGGTYTRLLNGFSYSPLTRVAGSPNQWLGAVGVAYTF